MRETENKPYELRIGVVGVGSLGSTIAYWLKRAGLKLSGVYDKNQEKAKRIASSLSSASFPSLQSLVNKVDIAIFSINDDSLVSIVDDLSEIYPFYAKYLFHTSGSISSLIFEPVSEKILYYSFHPMCAVSGFMKDENPFAGILFSCEGHENAENIARFLVSSLGGIFVKIDPTKKSLYHAGCCFLSNLLIANFLAGERFLKMAGFSHKEFKKALNSLCFSAAKGFVEKGFPDSLTGPIARNDLGVIERHLIAISGLPEEKLYVVLTEYLKNALNEVKANKNR